jgi:hypothetical protein
MEGGEERDRGLERVETNPRVIDRTRSVRPGKSSSTHALSPPDLIPVLENGEEAKRAGVVPGVVVAVLIDALSRRPWHEEG